MLTTSSADPNNFAPQSQPNHNRLGLLVSVSNNAREVMARVHRLGIPTAHVAAWDFSPASARQLRDAMDRYQVEVTVLFSAGPGKESYNLFEGPSNFGLVPSLHRRARIDHLKRASDFARQMGIPAIFNQWGFIPEVPSHPLYEPTVKAVSEIARHAEANGQMFLNETGQETPITLLRTIADSGEDNVGLVLDAGNLVLYDKGNPVDALDALGRYVRAVHVKGAFYPTDPRYIGRQTPAYVPSKVDWPRIIERLKKLGYQAPFTIEANTAGAGHDREVLGDKAYLEKLLS